MIVSGTADRQRDRTVILVAPKHLVLPLFHSWLSVGGRAARAHEQLTAAGLTAAGLTEPARPHQAADPSPGTGPTLHRRIAAGHRALRNGGVAAGLRRARDQP